MKTTAAPILLLTALMLAVPPFAAAVGLPDRPRAAIRQQLVPEDSVSVVVREVQGGDDLIEVNARVPRPPASTIKVLPTYAALDMLGPAYMWKTRALADGPVVQGVLQGNLYLQGGGDPLLTIERWWRFVTDLLQTGLQRSPWDPQRSFAERQRRQAALLQTIRDIQASHGVAFSATTNGARKPPPEAVAAVRTWSQRLLDSPTPGYAAYSANLVREGCAQFAQLHNSTSPEQRAHAVNVLQGYEADLRALAAQD